MVKILDIIPLPIRQPIGTEIDTTIHGFSIIDNSDISVVYGRKTKVEQIYRYKIVGKLSHLNFDGTLADGLFVEYLCMSYKPLFNEKGHLDIIKNEPLPVTIIAVRYYDRNIGYTNSYLVKENICDFLGINREQTTGTYAEHVLQELNTFSIHKGSYIEGVVGEEIENIWGEYGQLITNLSDISDAASSISSNEIRTILNYALEDIQCMNIPSVTLKNQLATTLNYLIPDIPEGDSIIGEIIHNTLFEFSGDAHCNGAIDLKNHISLVNLASINIGFIRNMYDPNVLPITDKHIPVLYSEENMILRSYLYNIFNFINKSCFTDLTVSFKYPDALIVEKAVSIYSEKISNKGIGDNKYKYSNEIQVNDFTYKQLLPLYDFIKNMIDESGIYHYSEGLTIRIVKTYLEDTFIEVKNKSKSLNFYYYFDTFNQYICSHNIINE